MKFTQATINTLFNRVYPPTGIWADFQHDYYFYQFLLQLVEGGRMETADLPPEPLPSAYSDTTSAKTR